MSGPVAPPHVVRRSVITPHRGPIRWFVRHHWVLAIGLVAVGVVAGWALPRIDVHAHFTFADTFDETTAQVTLAAIASGMITLTGFVFTAVTLVIQTVQARSPRLLRAIDGVDRTPIVFGLFAGTFTYALIVLSGIRPNRVPVISVYVALLLVLLCVGAFLRLLVALRSRLTSGGLVRTIGNQLCISFDKLYPMDGTELVDAPQHDGRRTTAVLQHEGAPGVFEPFDEVGLVKWTVAKGVVVTSESVVGAFVATGSRVATVASRPRSSCIRPPAWCTSARCEPSIKTPPMGYGSWSMSPCVRCRPRSTMRPPPHRQSTSWTICCTGSHVVHWAMERSWTRQQWCGSDIRLRVGRRWCRCPSTRSGSPVRPRFR